MDNIFVYQPLPFVKSIYYMDLDLYRYFIGRADQSVNEKVMVTRVDQQIRVTRQMIDAHDLKNAERGAEEAFPLHVQLSGHDDDHFLHFPDDRRFSRGVGQKTELWEYLRTVDPAIHHRMKYRSISIVSNFRAIRAGGFRSVCTGSHKNL